MGAESQRGGRYAAGIDDDFADLVLEELPFWSFEKAALFYATVPETLPDAYRRFLATNDRFWLLTRLLRRADACNEWCYDRAREVEAEPDDRLDLWGRYHYKSTIITFAGSIQEILKDPEITIAIFSNTGEIALPFLEQIKTELEENEELKALFPDVLWANPRSQAKHWSASTGNKGGITVRRKTNPKERTVQCFGLMEALPTGGHWKLRIYNDIVTYKSVTETDSDQMGKTIVRWQLSQNLGTHDHGGGRRWHEGTRYHYADAYSYIIDPAHKILTPRIYPSTHDGTLKGRPVFLTDEAWNKILTEQRDTVAAQHLQNPTAGKENTFLIEHLRPYELRPRHLNVYILGDPSQGKNKKSDRTALIVLGIDERDNRYLLDGYCHRMKLSETWTHLSQLYKKWKKQPGVQGVYIGYERYGLQRDTEYFEEQTFLHKIEGMSIDEVAWVNEGPQSKKARISRLEPYFRNSGFWMPPYVWHPDHGKCSWTIESKTSALTDKQGNPVVSKSGKRVVEKIEGTAEIVYHPVSQQTRREKEAKARQELFRLCEPIKRLDEDGNAYDLAIEFMDEYRMHPFAPHDDILDAASRIQDMTPVPPVIQSRVQEAPAFRDS